MINITTHKLFFKLIVLTFLLLSLWILSGSTPNTPQDEKYILIDIPRQLEPIDGVIPVELQCGPARITSPDKLENFSCMLRNNTNKNILAANVAYSIVFESNGKEVIDTRFHTVETFIHPDFYEANKSILPGGNCIIEPPGPLFYANSVIKRVEVKVEYVEFEDKTTLGPNEKGSQIIADIREGAAKYKNWLSRKYIEKGRSETAIVPFLQTDYTLPNELGLESSYKQQGARAYQTRLRHIHETRGAAQVEKYLNK